MKSLNDISVKSKFLILYALIMIGIVGFFTISLLGTRELKTNIEDLAENQLPAVRNMTLIDMHHDGIRAIVAEALLNSRNPKREVTESLEQEFNEQAKEMMMNIAVISKLDLSENTQADVASAKKSIEQYIVIANNLLNAAHQQTHEDKLASERAKFDESFSFLEEKLEKVAESIMGNAEAVRKESFAIANTKLQLIAFVGLGMMTAISLIIFQFIRAFTGRINPIMATVAQIESGNYLVRKSETSSDEIGQLSRSISSMAEKINDNIDQAQRALQQAEEKTHMAEQASTEAQDALRAADAERRRAQEALKAADTERMKAQEALSAADAERVKAEQAMAIAAQEQENSRNLAEREKANAHELRKQIEQTLQVVEKVGKGNLTYRIQIQGDGALAMLCKGLNSFFDQITRDLKTIQGMARNLEQESEVLNSKNHILNSNSLENRSLSVQFGATSREVIEKVRNIEKSTNELKIAISEVAKQAMETNRQVSQASDVVHTAKETGLALASSSDDISQFVNVVSTIARQTNLLALNAAIEAARTGEAGRGFMVVANEIKELAKQSSLAAEQITAKVKTIKENTSQMVSSITDINGVMNNISHSATVVASATEEQFATTANFQSLISNTVSEVDQIEKSSRRLTQSTDVTTSAIQENVEIASRLIRASEELAAIVAKFDFGTSDRPAQSDHLRAV